MSRDPRYHTMTAFCPVNHVKVDLSLSTYVDDATKTHPSETCVEAARVLHASKHDFNAHTSPAGMAQNISKNTLLPCFHKLAET